MLSTSLVLETEMVCHEAQLQAGPSVCPSRSSGELSLAQWELCPSAVSHRSWLPSGQHTAAAAIFGVFVTWAEGASLLVSQQSQAGCDGLGKSFPSSRAVGMLLWSPGTCVHGFQGSLMASTRTESRADPHSAYPHSAWQQLGVWEGCIHPCLEFLGYLEAGHGFLGFGQLLG